MKANRILCLLICLVFVGGLAHAQGVGSSGNINGTVTDPKGGVIAGASVIAVETAKGISFSAVTDADGEYRFAGLPPASYDVTVKVSGFQTEVLKNVVVTVGATAVADFQLRLASGSEAIVVTTEAPVVETERSHQADTVSEQYIMGLPIDRRDYLTITLLMPGVSDSTRLSADQDFRVKQTPQSGLSFYGSNGRGNSVTVDGGEANDDAGGVRLTLSQDAVQEFQVNRSNYTAELGGASGAAINIVSKSGGDELHGTIYSYFRNDALDAADPFAFKQALAQGAIFDPAQPDSVASNVKNSLKRYQYGGTAGFPIKRHKTFLFAAFEGFQQDNQSAVPILTNTNIFRPTAAQQAIISGLAAQSSSTMVQCFSNSAMTFPAPTCAGLLQAGLTVSQLTGLSAGQNALNTFLINQLESNGGLFNYATREYLASGRFDHHFSESNQLALNYRYGHDKEENPDVHSLTGFTAGSSIRTY